MTRISSVIVAAPVPNFLQGVETAMLNYYGCRLAQLKDGSATRLLTDWNETFPKCEIAAGTWEIEREFNVGGNSCAVKFRFEEQPAEYDKCEPDGEDQQDLRTTRWTGREQALAQPVEVPVTRCEYYFCPSPVEQRARNQSCPQIKVGGLPNDLGRARAPEISQLSNSQRKFFHGWRLPRTRRSGLH